MRSDFLYWGCLVRFADGRDETRSETELANDLSMRDAGRGIVPPSRSGQAFPNRPELIGRAEEPSKLHWSGVPRGIRTPVTAVKGRCPRPG